MAVSTDVTHELKLTVTLDPQVWSENYGMSVEDAKADIASFLPEVLTELVSAWIARTGNEGSVAVAEPTSKDWRDFPQT